MAAHNLALVFCALVACSLVLGVNGGYYAQEQDPNEYSKSSIHYHEKDKPESNSKLKSLYNDKAYYYLKAVEPYYHKLKPKMVVFYKRKYYTRITKHFPHHMPKAGLHFLEPRLHYKPKTIAYKSNLKLSDDKPKQIWKVSPSGY
ncbi:hypothetical protein KP509_12G046100 [Ceratopteris richardii]|uniref:Uncharacterized protein n=1 Tax=Ceratopteris richardii TaxID=49495 RepID=A0A8T2TKP8_CERRI|nr:hypothetical protein KP509_12G046100 [Ceratopteris richardii]